MSGRRVPHVNARIIKSFVSKPNETALYEGDKQVSRAVLVGCFVQEDQAVRRVSAHNHQHTFTVNDGVSSRDTSDVHYSWVKKADVAYQSPCVFCCIKPDSTLSVVGAPELLASTSAKMLRATSIEIVADDQAIVRQKYHTRMVLLRNKTIDYSKLATATSASAGSSTASSSSSALSTTSSALEQQRQNAQTQMRINKSGLEIEDANCKLLLSVFKSHYINHLDKGMTSKQIQDYLGPGKLTKAQFDAALEMLWSDYPILYFDDDKNAWVMIAV